MPRRRRRLGGGREGGGVAGSAEQDPAARSERRAGVRKAFAPGADTYRPPAPPGGTRPAAPYAAAGIATIAVWALYAWTLAPTTQFWDTSEYIATARILGIPHPPGNPLFVVLARAWDLLLEPTGLSVAVRINLFSATMSALAHGFWFLLAHRILSFFSSSGVFRLTGAAAATLLSATAFTVWNQSNVNEKVYTVSLFTIALLSWLAFRWRDRLGEGKDD
ncbi:MAG: protein O-mannosyl-transferase family, partial [Longimicrobiales bacterium]